VNLKFISKFRDVQLGVSYKHVRAKFFNPNAFVLGLVETFLNAFFFEIESVGHFSLTGWSKMVQRKVEN
jgi:hypothetical protein